MGLRSDLRVWTLPRIPRAAEASVRLDTTEGGRLEAIVRTDSPGYDDRAFGRGDRALCGTDGPRSEEALGILVSGGGFLIRGAR